MEDFDFLKFNDNVQSDIERARTLVYQIEDFNLSKHHYENDYLIVKEDEHDFNCEGLVEVIEQIKVKIEFALEFLKLNRLLTKLEYEFETFKKLDDLEYVSYIGIFVSPPLWTLEKYLNAITSHIKIDTQKDIEDSKSSMLLEQILRGSAKLLTDRKIEPSNEAEVRREIYNTLIHVFPDTVKEIPIAKISKTYKPDIGVKRLKTAIEYKFVDSETEAKTAIGGIFEDIQGYEGSEDWVNFYAVIYMTDNFLTSFQIDEEFKLSKVPHNWKPIIVYGKGARKRK